MTLVVVARDRGVLEKELGKLEFTGFSPFFSVFLAENFRELRLHFFFSLFDFEDLKFVRNVFTGTYGEVCESN